MNRLLSKAADPYFVTNHIGAASESFTYTATGKRATMTDASGTATYGYDTRDRLTSKATPEGSLAYTYDAAGDVKTIASSNANGASMAYGYDALDRLALVTDANGATSYGYDAVGNLQTVTYPNGVAHNYTYDTRNRLTGLNVAPGSSSPALFSYAYTLDAAGHRTSVTEQSGRKVNYSYDTIYRLTNETIASDPNTMNGSVSYTYDNVGNRLQKTSTLPGFPGASSTYNANDELTTDQYDADGNTVGSGLNTGTSGYVYDFENRLVQQAGISIVYDGDGNRVSKSTSNGTTQYLVDTENPSGYPQVMDEVQSSSVVRAYTWGLELVSEHQTLNSSLTTSYYVFDGHGSVRALTNAAGITTDTYDYDAFGILTHSAGTTPNNYLFAGEQFDPDLNLYYNRARYLNTSTGRFWSMDTDEGATFDPQSLHKFLYAGDSPIDRSDPSGNDYVDVVLAVAVVAVLLAFPTLTGPDTIIGTPHASTIGDAIGIKAQSYNGSMRWAQTVFPFNGELRLWDETCNKFVYDVLREVSVAPPLVPRKNTIRGKLSDTFLHKLYQTPPLAEEWADPGYAVPYWDVVQGGSDAAQAGDVIAARHEGGGGHSGIVVSPGQTASTSARFDQVGLSLGRVVLNDWGFRADSYKDNYGSGGKKKDSVVRRFTYANLPI